MTLPATTPAPRPLPAESKADAPLFDSRPRPRLTAPPTPADIDDLGVFDAETELTCPWVR